MSVFLDCTLAWRMVFLELRPFIFHYNMLRLCLMTLLCVTYICVVNDTDVYRFKVRCFIDDGI